jgi:two-component system response regulator YesN
LNQEFLSVINVSDHRLSNYLIESISAFSVMMKIPVTYMDNKGEIRLEWGEEYKICSHSHQYGDSMSPCGRNLLSSLNYASQLGEPYIFVCRGGLVKIAVALLQDNKLVGGFLAGPIVMASLRETTITKVLREDTVSDDDYPKLIMTLNKINSFTPEEVSHLSVMLNNCVLSSVENAGEYFIRNERYRRQTKLNSEVRKYKKTQKAMSYPHELEKQVSQLVSSGDSHGTVDVASQLMDEIYLLEAGDLEAVKMKIYSLCNLLIRGLPDWDQSSIEEDLSNLDILAEETDYESMKRLACSFLGDLAVTYAESFYHGSSEIVKKTIKYMNKHFKEKLTLGDSATHFHVNQSYLSALFKQEMGKSFTEYLTLLRLREAKKLLRETELNLTDIAYQCGFSDQSYFSKVFRKTEGLSPKEYRKQKRSSY